MELRTNSLTQETQETQVTQDNQETQDRVRVWVRILISHSWMNLSL